jgi:hypothetical protein
MRVLSGLGLLLLAGIAHAGVALFNLDELAKRATMVAEVEVLRVLEPQWKDANGSEVILAELRVLNRVKGEVGTRLVVALKPQVEDQPKMRTQERYVVFINGDSSAFFMGHAIRAFPIVDGMVISETIQGEPPRQPRAMFLEKLSRALK